jgi:diadenosine tetraphosphate (Ap4A) HIT family hydrolase
MVNAPAVDQPATRSGCYTCRINSGEIAAPGGPIYRDALWCLEHSIAPVPLAGWLVLKPLRHVEAFADLTMEEAAAFGPLTRRITQAMTEVLHPEKIYLSMYMEAPEFAHLHVHLIPRFEDTPLDHRGPGVFAYLRESKTSGRSGDDTDKAARCALAIRDLLRAAP